MQTRRVTAFDGLRGIGCCMVAFFWHYQHFGAIEPPANNVFSPLYRGGYYAVELFFILSGFTMEMRYANAIRNRSIDLNGYIKKRYMRLWPIQIVTLLVVTALELVYRRLCGDLFVIDNFDVYHFLLNVFMIQSGWIENSYSFNSPAWFISSLLLAYILFYFVNRICKDKAMYVYSLLVAASLIIRSRGCSLPFMHTAFAARAYMYFFCGALLCHLNEKNRMMAVPVAGVAVCTCSVVSRLIWHSGSIMLPFLGLVLFPMIVILAVKWELFARTLSCKLLRWLGEISSDVFFWHFPVQLTIVILGIVLDLSINYGSIWFLMAYIGITLFFSTISHGVTDWMRARSLANK